MSPFSGRPPESSWTPLGPRAGSSPSFTFPGLGSLAALEAGAPVRPSEALEIVLVVHGTFANPRHGLPPLYGELAWWQPGGELAKALDLALERHHSPARCNHYPKSWWDGRRGEEGSPRWHGWSGANSEVERRVGAYELARTLRALQRDPDVAKVHIVAHSHGGNVVRRALRYLNLPQRKLGEVICLGTPFLHFKDMGAWRRWVARTHWPMVIVTLGALAGAAAVARSGGDSSNTTYRVVALLAVAVAALYSAWRYFRTSEASAVDVAMRSLQFRRDEAINLLRSCTSLTAEPHLFLLDMLGGPVPARQRVRRGPAPARPVQLHDRVLAAQSSIWRFCRNAAAAWSDYWNGRLRRWAERRASRAYQASVLGSLWALVLIMGFRPYRPPLRPFISARMPRLNALFFHSMEEEGDRMMRQILREPGAAKPWYQALAEPLKNTPFDPALARPVAAFLAAAVYVLLYPIDKLLGIPAWLGAVGTRFAILIGARAAAGGAPGMDMLGAAYDRSRTDLPDQVRSVEIPEAIEQDIERRLAETSRVEVTTLRAAFDPAQRASLPAAIKTAFSDVGLLHAQYYQDARIVDVVAQCIAGKASPEWTMEAEDLSGIVDGG